MEKIFEELTEGESCNTNGGFALTTTLITVCGVKITGAMCVKAGAVLGLSIARHVKLNN